jgi:glycerophosphoryl diester phosphodiesterase
MPAFELAVAQGADLIELDVQMSSDGALVVMHDFTVDRTTDGQGLVKEHSLRRIKELNAAARFPGGFSAKAAVPALAEVLAWARGRVPVAIEIKSGPIRYPGIEARIVEAIEDHGMADSVVVISFDHSVLLRLKRLRPEIATGVLFACSPVAPCGLAMAAHADALLPHWSDLSPQMVEDAQSNGIAISTWAVDEERDMGWVASLGVDAIATNYPGRLAHLLKRTE